MIEQSIQTIQGMVRTLRSAIEKKWMVKLDPENALWTWLVEDAGWLVNREDVGHDGRTPHEPLKGKKARFPGTEFGEAVVWKRRPQGGPVSKLSCFWSEGIYLGAARVSTSQEMAPGCGRRGR